MSQLFGIWKQRHSVIGMPGKQGRFMLQQHPQERKGRGVEPLCMRCFH